MGSCLKKVVKCVFINLVFWIVTAVAAALIVWVILDPSFYIATTQDREKCYLGLYVFLTCLVLIVFMFLFGGYGAMKESKCMLITFSCVMIIVIAAEVTAIGWGSKNKEILKNYVRSRMRDSIKNDYGDNFNTVIFDVMQNGLGCCGAGGPKDWVNSKYSESQMNGGGVWEYVETAFTGSSFVMPSSCCRYQGETCEKARRARLTAVFAAIDGTFFLDGCSERLFQIFHDNYNNILTAGIVILAIEVLTLLLGIFLCCTITINSSEQYLPVAQKHRMNYN